MDHDAPFQLPKSLDWMIKSIKSLWLFFETVLTLLSLEKIQFDWRKSMSSDKLQTVNKENNVDPISCLQGDLVVSIFVSSSCFFTFLTFFSVFHDLVTDSTRIGKLIYLLSPREHMQITKYQGMFYECTFVDHFGVFVPVVPSNLVSKKRFHKYFAVQL